ncbi:Vps55 family protein [Ascoidea rubescens DSM 1968]|uniref:Vacuolar protein sorting 55 n=1 Tax=Ascoidea rubescens DSM 1968 TaxID=1344418 RepID=A0A1D2VJG6_9ASCO|nr:vacuolar protein sorting 55 [Ascoidea rubescens DSM 1968]ODV61647.1 vacuolar protein sorting 55 [Ascoidea rubescens DSM 1968]
MITINPLSKIICLSIILAFGFLLIVLSCAVYNNWRPLSVIGIFLVAPIPNAVFGKLDNNDFMNESTSSVPDFGKFLTGFLVLSGLALPLMLYHSLLITRNAMLMSMGGGFLVYLTIITFGTFFHEEDDEF